MRRLLGTGPRLVREELPTGNSRGGTAADRAVAEPPAPAAEVEMTQALLPGRRPLGIRGFHL
ncbi:hypothetical protein ACF05F_33420 [Rhodococcus erythropolis]